MPLAKAKVVLITGASGGIGKACASYLAANGYRVYGTSRSASEGGEDAGPVRMIPMDITDTISIREAVALIMQREGRIDALINNAGFHGVGPLECIPLGVIESCWRTNCLGAIQTCREVLPIMRSQGSGHIVNISSVGGVVGLAYQGAYSSSKFALEGMTESLRAEVRRFGIRVSLVEPSDIRHQDCRSDSPVSPEYEESFSRVMKIAWADEEKGYPPERIGPLIQKILSKRNPRARYTFGQAFQRAVPMLKRVLPNRFVEWVIGAYYRV